MKPGQKVGVVGFGGLGDMAAFKALKASFDFILSTIPEKHDLNPFIALLKRDSTICVVGALDPWRASTTRRSPSTAEPWRPR